ncbi:MAG TPA: hypothetical protein VEI24_05475, partial [Nitrospiria bacterium]|nr:hypothetical protein [Nitrospiria bacterium]
GGDGLNGYDGFVQALAKYAADFRRPVLLLNGDSHLYHVDRPLDPADRTDCVDTSTTAGYTGGAVLFPVHGTQPVPNLTRITVQGSTNHPSEWLKLTIDPDSPAVFSWVNVIYLP